MSEDYNIKLYKTTWQLTGKTNELKCLAFFTFQNLHFVTRNQQDLAGSQSKQWSQNVLACEEHSGDGKWTFSVCVR
jgi:hypothetical protein